LAKTLVRCNINVSIRKVHISPSYEISLACL
jgi:hypothetical protein